MATIENIATENINTTDISTLQTSVITTTVSESKHASNDTVDVIELTGQNFDEELRKSSLLVMFYLPG